MTALSYIGDSIRHAGFYGIGTAVTVVDAATAAVATTTDCGSAANPPAANWAINTAAPMVGFDGLTAATVNATLPCVLASNFQAGQALAVRLADEKSRCSPCHISKEAAGHKCLCERYARFSALFSSWRSVWRASSAGCSPWRDDEARKSRAFQARGPVAASAGLKGPLISSVSN